MISPAIKNYGDMRRYWKNVHGYELPLEVGKPYITRGRVDRFFLVATYQNEELSAKVPQNYPMAIKYTKLP
jgi:hypothetical protein